MKPTSPNRPALVGNVYLDNQATTPCDPAVLAVMWPWFAERFGNPHSVEHAMGREAEAAVETARAQLATLMHADPRELVFTSGATEANNLAIQGAARFAAGQGSPRRRILTFAGEHSCVLESVRDLAARGFEPEILPVASDGRADLDALEAALDDRVLLVSAMAANNEIGSVNDLAAIVRLAKRVGALVHSDAAQAVGKIEFDPGSLGLDLVSVSAHKLYGPKGVGALWIRRRPRVRIAPLFSGGGQERGLRPGTLPAPLLIGFGEAARIAHSAMPGEASRLAVLAARLRHGLQTRLPGTIVNGAPLPARIPGNLNVTLPAGTDAQALMAALPALCVSTGSACSSAAIEPSHVLRAIGLSEEAASRTLRLGLGRFTTEAEVDYAVDALAAAHARLSVQARHHPIPALHPEG